MIVVLNGNEREIPNSTSLAGLISLLELKPERLAIELNRSIVKKADWGTTVLADSDKIEIVHFVGGGARSSCLDRLFVTDYRGLDIRYWKKRIDPYVSSGATFVD